MARILIVTWDGGGNVPPALGIATEMRRRGHDVRALGHAQQRATFASAGIPFTAYAHARSWSSAAAVQGARAAARYIALFTDKGPGRDLADEVAQHPVDLVLADCMCLGALRAAQRAGVPTAVLVHTFHRYVTHGWARGPIGAIAALRGLRPSRLWDGAAVVLVATDPGIDPATAGPQPPNVRYTGPVQAAPRATGRPDDPAVLVSLSTIYYEGQTEVLQRILDGIADLPLRAVVTTGGVPDPAVLRVPGNVEVHRHLPHEEVMPTVSLVVGHGGHATTMRALAHDLPLLVIPMHPMLDQPMVGRVVAAAGAGRTLPKSAHAAQIRDAVQALVVDGPHRAAAAAIGSRLRARNGAATAADELDDLLRASRRGSAAAGAEQATRDLPAQ